MSRTDAVSNRSAGEKQYRREMAARKAARTAPTVEEVLADELSLDHRETVESGLGTTCSHSWWLTPRKRVEPDLENLHVLDELKRDRFLAGRPGTPVAWTSGQWSTEDDSLAEHRRRLQAREAHREARRVNALLVAQMDAQEPAKPREQSIASMMSEIPSRRGGMRMRRAHVVS